MAVAGGDGEGHLFVVDDGRVANDAPVETVEAKIIVASENLMLSAIYRRVEDRNALL